VLKTFSLVIQKGDYIDRPPARAAVADGAVADQVVLTLCAATRREAHHSPPLAYVNTP